MQSIPRIDISNNTNGAEVLDALKNYGFFYITGHGIENAKIKEMMKISETFFNKGAAFKLNFDYVGKTNSGYLPPDKELLNVNTKADPKEAYNLRKFNGKVSFSHPPELEVRFVQEFAHETQIVALNVLQKLAIGLGIDPKYFATRHVFEDESGDILRLLNYPPTVDPSIILAGGHSDYGSLTLLFQDEIGGLEVFHNNGWIPIPPIEGAIVVNAGDLMSFWTCGLIKSAIHRVVGNSTNRSRKSIAYFLHPTGDTSLDPIPSTKIANVNNKMHERHSIEFTGTIKKSLTANEHLMQRLKDSRLD